MEQLTVIVGMAITGVFLLCLRVVMYGIKKPEYVERLERLERLLMEWRSAPAPAQASAEPVERDEHTVYRSAVRRRRRNPRVRAKLHRRNAEVREIRERLDLLEMEETKRRWADNGPNDNPESAPNAPKYHHRTWDGGEPHPAEDVEMSTRDDHRKSMATLLALMSRVVDAVAPAPAPAQAQAPPQAPLTTEELHADLWRYAVVPTPTPTPTHAAPLSLPADVAAARAKFAQWPPAPDELPPAAGGPSPGVGSVKVASLFPLFKLFQAANRPTSTLVRGDHSLLSWINEKFGYELAELGDLGADQFYTVRYTLEQLSVTPKPPPQRQPANP